MPAVSSLKALLAACTLAIPSIAWGAMGPDVVPTPSDPLSAAPNFSAMELPAAPAPVAFVDAPTAPLDPDNMRLSSVPSSTTTVTYLDDAAAPPPESPNIHGFVEFPFKTGYMTPRGLIVENKGLVMQPVGGLVLPIGDIGPVKGFTLITGIWNSINTYQHDPFVGTWNEMDYFATASGNVGKFSGALTYSPWNSPPHSFRTEENIDFKVSYNDKDTFMPGLTINPYVDWFWAVAGDSPVINGRSSSYYFELGVVPTYKFKFVENYPLTVTVPTYVQVGPKNFWGRGDSAETKPDGNVGVFSISLNGSVPLSFIPAKYGFWHADAGVQYFWLVNDALLRAGGLASGNTNRNPVNASVGIGVNF
jgi:hypothetical protein